MGESTIKYKQVQASVIYKQPGDRVYVFNNIIIENYKHYFRLNR